MTQSTVTKEISRLRDCLSLPPDEIPEAWRVFVAEYRRQKADAERMAVSDDKEIARRGRLMLANLERMV